MDTSESPAQGPIGPAPMSPAPDNTALILGIVGCSLLVLGLAPVSLVLGIIGLRRVQRDSEATAGAHTTQPSSGQAARILNWVSTIVGGIATLLIVALVGLIVLVAIFEESEGEPLPYSIEESSAPIITFAER